MPFGGRLDRGRGGGKGGIVEEGIGEIVNISAGPLSVEGKGEENDELVELYSVFQLFPIWQKYFFTRQLYPV